MDGVCLWKTIILKKICWNRTIWIKTATHRKDTENFNQWQEWTKILMAALQLSGVTEKNHEEMKVKETKSHLS